VTLELLNRCKYVSIKWACAQAMLHFLQLRLTETFRNGDEPLPHKQLCLHSLSHVQLQGSQNAFITPLIVSGINLH